MPIRPENSGRYPKDWALRSRFVRFVRARGRCEWCGAAHGNPHPVTGSTVVLTCAHVYDKRPEACSLLNLAALCQRCHLAHDAPDRHTGRQLRLAFLGRLNDRHVSEMKRFYELYGFWPKLRTPREARMRYFGRRHPGVSMSL